MPQIKYKYTNNGSISGKKEIAFLTVMPFNSNGAPNFIAFTVKFKEVDENTDAIPSDGTLNARRVVKEEEYNFQLGGRKISSITKLYLPDDTTDVNAVTLENYFATKVINTFPAVAGADPLSELAEGLLREAISIMQANGELSI